MMLLPFITSCVVLVPRLSAVPQELTCTRNCYFEGLTLREDLPGRFFTTLTPQSFFRTLITDSKNSAFWFASLSYSSSSLILCSGVGGTAV